MKPGQKFLCFEVRGAAFQMAITSKYKNEGEYGPSYNGGARNTLLKSHVYFRDTKEGLDVDKVKEVVGWRQIAGLYLRLMSGGTLRLMKGGDKKDHLTKTFKESVPQTDKKSTMEPVDLLLAVLSHVQNHTSLVDFNIGDREFVVLRKANNKRINKLGSSPNYCYLIPSHRVTYDIKMLLDIPAAGELATALSAITCSPFPLSIGGGVVSVYDFTPSEFFTVPNPYKANVLEKLVDYTDVGDLYACADSNGGLNIEVLEGILDSFAMSAFKVDLKKTKKNADPYFAERGQFIKALQIFLDKEPIRMDDIIKKFETAIDKKLTGKINKMKVDDNGAIKDDITLGCLCAEVYAEEMAEVQTLVADLDALLSAQRVGPKILKRIMMMAAGKIARVLTDDKYYVFETVGKKEDAFKGVTTVTTLEDIAKIVKYELAKLAKETP